MNFLNFPNGICWLSWFPPNPVNFSKALGGGHICFRLKVREEGAATYGNTIQRTLNQTPGFGSWIKFSVSLVEKYLIRFLILLWVFHSAHPMCPSVVTFSVPCQTQHIINSWSGDKMLQSPHVCYTFETQGVQGCQIWLSPGFELDLHRDAKKRKN